MPRMPRLLACCYLCNKPNLASIRGRTRARSCEGDRIEIDRTIKDESDDYYGGHSLLFRPNQNEIYLYLVQIFLVSLVLEKKN